MSPLLEVHKLKIYAKNNKIDFTKVLSNMESYKTQITLA